MANVIVAPSSVYTVTFFADPNASDITRGTAIDNHGVITGWYVPNGGLVASYTANVVDNGSGSLTVGNFVTLNNPTTAGLEAYGINDFGELVGGTFANGESTGFRVADGNFSIYTAPMAISTTLWGLDDAGDVVGGLENADGSVEAFMATPSGAVSRFTIGGGYATAYGINNTGTIVGTYSDTNGLLHGFIVSGVTTTTLDVPGAVATNVYGVNNNGQISGTYENPQGQFTPFMYQDGTYTVYDEVQAGPFTTVGIDDAGQLIGTALVDRSDDGFIIDPTGPPCFRRGSRIRTVAGEVAVEDLRQGDLVLTFGGAAVAVAWIGHRRVDCRRHPRPSEVRPVRVRAEAFGAGLPHRDLWLSPDHAVFVDGVLIPIRHLINDRSITQMLEDEAHYYHVELPRHDVLLAEGLPAESYLDTGNRAGFANGGGAIALHPEFSSLAWEACGCAPLIVAGPILQRVRRRVNRRAANRRFGASVFPNASARAADG